jgi:hypothetical protein
VIVSAAGLAHRVDRSTECRIHRHSDHVGRPFDSRRNTSGACCVTITGSGARCFGTTIYVQVISQA